MHPAKSSPQLNDLLNSDRIAVPTSPNPNRWRGSTSNCAPTVFPPLVSSHLSASAKDLPTYLKLGPGQIHPKGYRLTSGRYGELNLGIILTSSIEIEVIIIRILISPTMNNKHPISPISLSVRFQIIAARNIVPVDCDTPPDTYVKCYIKDGDRLKHKKKTRVIRHSVEPQYKQILKYQVGGVERS